MVFFYPTRATRKAPRFDVRVRLPLPHPSPLPPHAQTTQLYIPSSFLAHMGFLQPCFFFPPETSVYVLGARVGINATLCIIQRFPVDPAPPRPTPHSPLSRPFASPHNHHNNHNQHLPPSTFYRPTPPNHYSLSSSIPPRRRAPSDTPRKAHLLLAIHPLNCSPGYATTYFGP